MAANKKTTQRDKLDFLDIRSREAIDEFRDLKRYLESDKFHTDTTVQVADVLRRMSQLGDLLLEMRTVSTHW